MSYDSLSPTSLSSRVSLLDVPNGASAKSSFAAGGLALVLHGGLVLIALTAGARVTQEIVQIDVSQLIDVELPVPQEQAPEQSEPIAEPAHDEQLPNAPTPAPSESIDPTSETESEPPPAPAEAGEVLTADEEVIDFGDTVVSSTGNHFSGGLTASDGTSKVAVRNPHARSGGVPGGTGSGQPVTPVKKSVDLSRSPRLAGGMQWDCPFPAEADMEQINEALVSLQVQVSPDGKVQNVTVVSDPGYGFGREVTRCALRKRWDPGTDREGKPKGATARIQVRFHR